MKFTSLPIFLSYSALTLGLAALLGGCATQQIAATTPKLPDALPSAGKEQIRITDSVIRADRQYLNSLQKRLLALNEKGVASNNYYLSKATAWLDFANEEYADNDRSGIVELLVEQTRTLIQKLEAGDSRIDRTTTIVRGSQKIRSDLWAKAATYQSDKEFGCIAGKLGQAEVQLVWAGHEEIQGGWRHAKPYIEIAEDMFKKIELALPKCTQPVVQEAKTADQPAVIAAATVTPETIVVKTIEIERMSLSSDTLFPFNKTSINDVLPEAKPILAEFVARLRQLKTVERILITGHTDRVGSASYNLKLSETRAEAIQQYLVQQGFAKDLIQIAGAGESDPVVTCSGDRDSAELRTCLQPNRRVEVRVRGVR
jgi:OmpA-OmpF porin, OOP family